MRYLLMCVLLMLVPQEESWWLVKATGTEANLRGVAVAVLHGKTTVWATGSKGTVLRSTDKGESWHPVILLSPHLDYHPHLSDWRQLILREEIV